MRTDTPGKGEQIDGEAEVERREGSRLRPGTAAELAGARRNRSATAKAKGDRVEHGSERGERGRQKVVRSVGPNRCGLTWFNQVTEDLVAISKNC